ncbi:MAG: polysaccharide biosynthesis C-terminal domain-containing protein, partial [Ferroplasma sp.]
RTLLNTASLIYIPGALGIAALGRITLYNFAGRNYTMAYVPIIIIMVVSSLFVGSVILAAGIKSVRQSKIFLYSSGLALASNLIFSMLLIPKFLIIGASISYSSMTAVNFLIIFHYARKFHVSNYDLKTIGKIWTASLLMFFIIFYLQSVFTYNIPVEILYIFFGIAIYMVEIKIFKIINIDELSFVLTVIPERFKRTRNMLRFLSS